MLVSSLVPGIKAVLERRISTNHFSFIFLIFIDLSVPDYLVAGCRILVAACGLSLAATSYSYSLVRVHGLSIAVAALAQHRLWGARASVVAARGLSS